MKTTQHTAALTATGAIRGLVITRREGEAVLVGDPSNPIGRVIVGSIRGNQVRIVFDFPAGLAVNRAEVAADKIKNGSSKR